VQRGQSQIDSANASFWDELCGTTLAQQLGITDADEQSLERFDRAFLGEYPYIEKYLPTPSPDRERLLEVGLGYGTVGGLLARRGFDYHGLDISPGPVEMMRQRLRQLRFDRPEERVRVGSVLENPHPDESFDHVVTIGCLHHTGDIPRAVSEVKRVLRPGGRAVVMLYNERSYRRLRMGLSELPAKLRRRHGRDDEAIRAAYDTDSEGEAAPATDFTTVREAKRLFADCSEVVVRRENFDYMVRRGGAPISREFLLGWPARLAGLDLYITAVK
jgi:SAM-dependent methyltransferase